ncbi:MAG: hypothetical protein KIS94_14315 [Chitinophagales bacterium]|nr:hypothetical protein [Chitinophagales bacterium]
MSNYKSILPFVALLLTWQVAFSNVAMPGFWGNGNGSNFFPLMAADSAHVGKIQMQREEITILLYPGFAVVKGTYYMYNHTSDTVRITTGYPVNGSLSNDEVYSVSVSDLHALKVLVGNIEVSVTKEESDNNISSAGLFGNADNWYVWQAAYTPNAITTIDVYFLVNTGNSVLRKGYSKKKGNAFTYILESGRVWRDSIDKGRISVFMKGGLKISDFMGVYPRGAFSGNDTFMQYRFEKLKPTASNNIILWYKAQTESVDFEKQVSNASVCYALADRILFPSSAYSFKIIDAYNFQVSKVGTMAIGALFTLAIVGPLLAGITILAVIIFFAVRYFKKKTTAT